MKQLVNNHQQATIGHLEELAMTDSYAGSDSRLYSLVDTVSDINPEASEVHLVSYQHSTTYLHPAREGWLDKMANLVQMGFTARRPERLIRLVVLVFLNCGRSSCWRGVEGEVDRLVVVQAVKTVAFFATKATESSFLKK